MNTTYYFQLSIIFPFSLRVREDGEERDEEVRMAKGSWQGGGGYL